MSEQDPLRAWIEARRPPGVPAGFPQRVMDALHLEPRLEARWLSKPWLVAAACVAASLVLFVRLGSVVSVLWPR